MENYQEVYVKAKEFFTKVKNEDGLVFLKNIEEKRKQEKVKICFVGGFSRGKTTSINAILNTNIFPEAVSPTTTLITKIEYNKNQKITLVKENKQEKFPLTKENLDLFSATGKYADISGVLTVAYDNELLPSHCTIYDTPGIDDVLSQRASVVFNTLDYCDFAVIAISAINPLTLSEQAFIKNYLYEKKIPKIAILLTFLDKIAEEDLSEQMDYIIKKAKNLYPDIEIWCNKDISVKKSACTVYGFEDIRKRIVEWTNDENLQNYRDEREYKKIVEYIKNDVALTQILYNNLQGDMETKQKELQNQLVFFQDKQSNAWSTIKEECLNKSVVASEMLQTQLQDSIKKLKDSLHKMEKDKVQSVIQLEINKLIKDLSEHYAMIIQKDIKELAKFIQTKYGMTFDIEMLSYNQINANRELNFTEQNNSFYSTIYNFIESNYDKLLLIIGSKIPAMGMELLKIGLEQIFSKVKSLFNEKNIQTIDKELDQIVIMIKAELIQLTKENYTNLLEQIRLQQQNWIMIQKENLSKEYSLEEQQEQQKFLFEKIELGNKIINN